MNRPRTALVTALALLIATPALAQHAGHSMPGMVMPSTPPASNTAAKPPAKKTATASPKPASKKPPTAASAHNGMDMSSMPGMDMSMPGMDMGPKPAKKPAKKTAPSAAPKKSPAKTPHVMPGMDMSSMPGMDMGHTPTRTKTKTPAKAGATASGSHDMSGMEMSGMDHTGADKSSMPGMDMSGMDHSGMDMSSMPGMAMPGMTHGANDLPAKAAPHTPVPNLTDADRAAAFPDVDAGHATHDRRTHSFWLVDRLEAHDSGGGAWDATAWIGGDIDRTWLRTEGETDSGIADGDLEVLRGHSIGPWWDVVAGVRQDFGGGPARTALAFGVQGLAPYKFDVQATGYLDTHGRASARLESEYDTLLTNRLILQWRGEANLYGKGDPARGIGSGLSTLQAGARVRYEITRRFAPYVGVDVERAFGDTAGLRRDEGNDITDTRVVAGLRLWF